MIDRSVPAPSRHSPPVEFVTVISTALAIAFGAIALAPAGWRVPLWVAVIAACVVPWTSWQGHEHWDKVTWVPFSTTFGPLRLRDIVVNVLLYVPLGFWWVGQVHGARSVPVVTTVSCLLSLATEWSQVYAHGRFPSMTDVVMNTVGGLVGALIASAFARTAGHRGRAPG
jgi:glycopeptide antibiotics resistance protein